MGVQRHDPTTSRVDNANFFKAVFCALAGGFYAKKKKFSDKREDSPVKII